MNVDFIWFDMHISTFKSYFGLCPPCCLADIYFEIWDRQCWSWLIFRQASGLFCRTGLRRCNFWKWVQPPMLTGNVHCSECIHMASTNKQFNTISTLWLHRKLGGKRKKASETTWNRQRVQSNRWSSLLKQIFINCVKKEGKFWLIDTHSQTNIFGLNSNICAHFDPVEELLCFHLNWGGSLWEADWKKWHT